MREAGLRRGALVVAVSLAAVLAFLLAPGASAQSSCGWTVEISGAQANVAFPDQAARYWVAQIPIPPAFHVEVDGQFPHARYISYITYDAATRAIDGIHDAQIAPDSGSINPFVARAARTGTNRSSKGYYVGAQPPPGRRTPT